jgi:hypothetical protein
MENSSELLGSEPTVDSTSSLAEAAATATLDADDTASASTSNKITTNLVETTTAATTASSENTSSNLSQAEAANTTTTSNESSQTLSSSTLAAKSKTGSSGSSRQAANPNNYDVFDFFDDDEGKTDKFAEDEQTSADEAEEEPAAHAIGPNVLKSLNSNILKGGAEVSFTTTGGGGGGGATSGIVPGSAISMAIQNRRAGADASSNNKYSCSLPRDIPFMMMDQRSFKANANVQQKPVLDENDEEDEENYLSRASGAGFDAADDDSDEKVNIGEAISNLASSIVVKDGRELFGGVPSRRIPINSISQSYF